MTTDSVHDNVRSVPAGPPVSRIQVQFRGRKSPKIFIYLWTFSALQRYLGDQRGRAFTGYPTERISLARTSKVLCDLHGSHAIRYTKRPNERPSRASSQLRSRAVRIFRLPFQRCLSTSLIIRRLQLLAIQLKRSNPWQEAHNYLSEYRVFCI